MDKKAIQEQRMKGYFIDAAKKVIKEEGISNLTVKKVADLAGYAPGTLYNYFTDLNTLLFYCTVDFWEECKNEVLKKGEEGIGVKEKIINYSQAYCEYFIDNPNVFQLIFLEDLGDILEELEERVADSEVPLLLQKILKDCVDKGIIPERNVTIIENLIGHSIHGILLFFIKERSTMTKEEVLKLIEDEVNYLLDS